MKSKCCGYEVGVRGKTTKHYYCKDCGEPCDITNPTDKPNTEPSFDELLHETKEWCERVKYYDKIAGIDNCSICGMNPEILGQLLDGFEYKLEEIRDSERNIIFSISRKVHENYNAKKVMKIYKEWDYSRKTEQLRKDIK